MAIANLLPLNIGNNRSVHNLALFICHLFIDAEFRNIHVVHEPRAFDHQILNEINNVCAEPIPMYMTDVSQPFELPWNPGQNTDNTLQFIFFGTKQLLMNMAVFRDSIIPVYYRVFVFSLNSNENDMQIQYKIVKEFNSGHNSSTLILYHNVQNDSVLINWLPVSDDDVENHRPINILPALILAKNTKIGKRNRKNLYVETFGKYDGKRSISINVQIFAMNDHDDGNEETKTTVKYVSFRV